MEEGSIVKTQKEAFEFLSHYIQYSSSYSSSAQSQRYTKPGQQFTQSQDHQVATLLEDPDDRGSRLVYQRPEEIQAYDYEGPMYEVRSDHVDLLVTPNHRMYVRHERDQTNNVSSRYCVQLSEEILGKLRNYKKNADLFEPDRLQAPELVLVEECASALALPRLRWRFCVPKYGIDYPLDHWLTVFGILIAKGTMNTIYTNVVEVAAHTPRVKEALGLAVAAMDIEVVKYDDEDHVDAIWYLHGTTPIGKYLNSCLKGVLDEELPDWVWGLDQEQCRTLIDGIMMGDGHTMTNGTRLYCTSSTKLADHFQRLCLHAGFSCHMGNTKSVTYRLTVVTDQNEPLVNKYKEDDRIVEEWKGKVHCVTVPDGPGVIYVRRNGVPLMEALDSKACAMDGRRGDASPFNGRTVEDIAAELEAHGMERYGNEVMYNPRTGEQIPCSIFVCPTYYQRLKHMVEDKVHCLTGDHDVLTSSRWRPIGQLSMGDSVATLGSDGKLEYSKPLELICYPEYHGRLFHIKDRLTDLLVTEGHRMFVSSSSLCADPRWSLVPVEEIEDHMAVAYKNNVLWGHKPNVDVDVDMMGAFAYSISDHQGGLPEWAWTLSLFQSHVFVLLLSTTNTDKPEFQTNNPHMAEDVSRLAVHAGLSSVQETPTLEGLITIRFYGVNVSEGIVDPSRTVSVTKTGEVGGKGVRVYCMSVPGEVFYVRRNGCAVWTAGLPAKGRARDGGLRLGEMEMECLWAHGAMSFLKERFMECSDNYKVFVCKECGMIAHVNPEKCRYHCKACKNITRFSEVRIPYAGKLLMQEIQTMGIATRFVTDE
eukprot:gene20467-27256_t